MNRPIKFRAWTGMTMEYKVMAGYLGAFYCSGLDEKDCASMSPFNTIYPENTPVMQFTGLLDTNGKEIWEGDIVKFENNEKPFVVEYENGRVIGSYCSNWNAEPDEMVTGAINPDFYDFKEVGVNIKDINGVLSQIPVQEFLPVSTVIGNIHQNPELLAL